MRNGQGVMSQLPPYSTFRTDSKQMLFPQATSHGNILTFTPPGFKQTLNVKFPDSRLAVCEKCKKNFKTKDMCRVRNAHTAPPWTTAYVCVTIDDSCLTEDGKFIDKPLTLRMVSWRPYAARKPFHHKTPVCAGCKKTNRTRSFCREKHKHRQLPWCTVYVLLSALDQADPATVVAGPSRPVSDDDSKSPESTGPATIGGKVKAVDDSEDHKNSDPPADVASASTETISSDVDETDDINDIAESRTFMAKVNCSGSSIHWLDQIDYEDDASSPAYPSAEAFSTPTIDSALTQAQYLAQAHYVQQQNALKSHQQQFFEQQQRFRWQQQYAQQISRTGVGSDSIIAAGETALQQCHASGTSAAVAVTASPVGMLPHPHAWPIYYAALQPGYYSPSVQATSAAQPLPVAEYSGAQDQQQQPPPAVAGAASDRQNHQNNTGDNSEEARDAKRHRAI